MLNKSVVWSRLVVVVNKLSQVTSRYQLFNCDFKLEALFGLIAIVFVIPTIVILVPIIWWALQLPWILKQVLGLYCGYNLLNRPGERCECDH